MKRLYLPLFLLLIILFCTSSVFAQGTGQIQQEQSQTVSQTQNTGVNQNIRQAVTVSQENRLNASGSALQQSLQSRTQVWEEKKEQFKQKLGLIKDEKKKERLQKIQDETNNINQKILKKMADHLQRLQQILGKIQTRATKKQQQGAGMDQVLTQINGIKINMQNTNSQLNTQMEKNYVMDITTEEKLKTDAGKMHQEMRADLNVLQTSLMDLRKQIVDVLQLLISTKPEMPPVATSSAILND